MLAAVEPIRLARQLFALAANLLGVADACVCAQISRDSTPRELFVGAGPVAVTVVESVVGSLAGVSVMSVITAVFALILAPFRAYRACMGGFSSFLRRSWGGQTKMVESWGLKGGVRNGDVGFQYLSMGM